MKNILLSLCGFLLLSCSVHEQHKQDVKKIAITKNCDLLQSKIWTLKDTGSYLQKIDVNTKDQSHSFLLHLTVDAYSLKAIAIHDLQGRIDDLHLTPQDLKWSAIPEIKNTLKPEYILIDFLLTHLSLSDLKKACPTLTVIEKHKKRIIKDNDDILRTITMLDKKNGLCQNITIQNPKHKYTLSIQTVAQ